MTLVYDPRQFSKGRRITKRSRPHRRPDNGPSSWKAKVAKDTPKSNQTQILREDLLDFSNQHDESIPQPTSAIRQPELKNIPPDGASFSLNKSSSHCGNRSRQTALAVDTRFIEALQDTDLPQSIIHNILSLLQKTTLRGVAPSVISVSQMKHTRKGVSCIGKILKNLADLKPLYISTQSIEPKSGMKQETTNGGGVVVQLPKLLTAQESWKLFGDCVASALQSPVFQESGPCHNMTVLTNDISFLSDNRAYAHTDGLNMFWDHCKPFFLEHKLNSIEIVVLWTNAKVIDTRDGATTGGMGSEETVEQKGDDQREEETSVRPARQTEVAKFVAALNQQLREKGEEEFRANRSNIQFDVTQHIPAIAMSVSIVENSIFGMMSLLREWSRNEVPGPQQMTLHFPNTRDSSDRNKLQLDATYKTIPFALDSELTLGLQNDLKLIAQSKLEVMKAVSIESVDASLLYGVPIRVRSGLQAEMESHQAMVQMVQSLFHHMSKKERALIITSSPLSSTESTTNTTGLFHRSVQHTFVLMAEEIPVLLRHTVPPSTGILLRLATSDQFIEEVGAFDSISTVGEKDLNAFSELMEHTLDSIAYSDSNVGFNPLYINALQARQVLPADQPNNEIYIPYETGNENIEKDSEGKWNDNSGVGSSEAAFTAAQELVSTEATPVQSGTYCPPSSKQPESTYEPELEDDDDSRLQRLHNTNSIPLVLDRCRYQHAQREGETATAEEVEWTDDEGADSFRMGESPDSDDSDGIGGASVGVFEYSD